MRKVVISLVACLILCSGVFAQDFGYLTNMGIYGGELGDVAINPTTPEVMYVAATWGEGIFKSTNGGASWSTIPDLAGKIRGRRIVINPTNPNIVYYASSKGISKSIDNGVSWTQPLADIDIESLALAPSSPEVLYATHWIGGGTANEKRYIIKSSNGGVSWEGTNFPTIEASGHNLVCLAVHPTNPNLVFAGSGTPYRSTWGNLWKSNDGGATWHKVIDGTTSNDNLIGWNMAFKGTTEAYVPTKKGIYKSTDPTFEVWTLVMDASAETGGYPYGAGLSVDVATDGTIYAGTERAIWKSSTGNAGSWTKTNYSYHPGEAASATNPVLVVEPRQVKIHPTDSNLIYAGSGFGLHKSTDGGTTWTAVNTGITSCQIWVAKKAGTTIYAGAERSVHKTTDGGSTWSVFKATPTRIRGLAVDPTNSNRIFIAYGGGEHSLVYTTDGGTTWGSSEVFNNTSVFEVSSIVVNPTTPEVVYAAGGDYLQNTTGGLYKTTNGGTTWASIESVPWGNNCLQKVVLDPKNPEIVYVGVSAIHFYTTPGGLYRSINGGGTWEALLSGTTYPINDILIDPDDPNIIYVALTGNRTDRIYKTTNGGSTWIDVSSGIISPTENIEVTSLAFDASDKRIIYAGVNSQKGIYYTVDGGANWSKLASSLYDIMDVEPGSLYVATSGGLFSFSASAEPYAESGDKPIIYNYPNPFNPATGGTTTVSFSLPSGVSGSTTVKIFDLSGELVRSLVSESKDGGATYTVSWDGKNDNGEIVASGVYIALIVVNGKPQYSKIAVIK